MKTKNFHRALAVIAFSILFISEVFAGEAIGNPCKKNKWSTESCVQVRANHAPKNRSAVNVINGSGLDINNGMVHDNKPNHMWLADHMSHGYPKHPGTIEGGQWIAFKFNKPYHINKMLIWNYAEGHYWAWTTLGMNMVTIQYTNVKGKNGWGSENPKDWKTIFSGKLLIYRKGDELTPNNIIDFKGALAQYVVITTSIKKSETNYTLEEPKPGKLTLNSGLSEVRFITSDSEKNKKN